MDPVPPLANPRPTLVVTRPAEDARALIEALRTRGHPVVALPVLAIEPVPDATALADTMARVDGYRLVVFVSPNAIRRSLAHRVASWPADTVVGVMGPGSVATLKTFGIEAPLVRVYSPADGPASDRVGDRFDSEALFATLDARLGLASGFDGRVLIVRGNGGRAWFAERLRALGIAVDEVEAYRRVRPEADAETSRALRKLFGSAKPAVFIVTSSEGVANLATIVTNALRADPAIGADAARAWLLGSALLAPHRRIAERARQLGFREVVLCAPGDRGIVAAIE